MIPLAGDPYFWALHANPSGTTVPCLEHRRPMYYQSGRYDHVRQLSFKKPGILNQKESFRNPETKPPLFLWGSVARLAEMLVHGSQTHLSLLGFRV